MGVTQKQIAEQVGVTQQLVALALRDSPRVAEQTRQRIQQAALEMGYHAHANPHARRLAAVRHGKRAATGLLALVFEPLHERTATADPYFMPLIDGVEVEAMQRGLDLLLVPARPTGLPWLIREGWVDGVILLGSHQPNSVEEISCPLVALGANLTVQEQAASLLPDDAGGMAAVARHLLQLGHRRIAYLGPRHWPSGRERFEGMRQCLEEAGCFGAALIERSLSEPSVEAGMMGARRLIERVGDGAFTALMCHNDLIAMGAIPILQGAGLSVPADVSVTGFDDVSLQHDFLPALTSVQYDRLGMGRRAVQFIAEAVLAETESLPFTPGHEVFPVQLIARDSTAPVASLGRAFPTPV